MKINPLNKGIRTTNSAGSGPVTRGMVRERAIKLAVINGRSAHDVAKSAGEQAKRELHGEPGMDSTETTLESAPESERWDPLPGSTGHQVPESPSEDEDDEGRSESEQLVEGGVEEAGRDQMHQAALEATRKDKREP